MAGLDPAIHVDARNKSGHDGCWARNEAPNKDWVDPGDAPELTEEWFGYAVGVEPAAGAIGARIFNVDLANLEDNQDPGMLGCATS